MPRRSQRLTRGARGSQTGVTEATWRRLLALWGLTGKALVSARKTPRDHFGINYDSKLNDFASNLFKAVFLKFV